MSRFVLYVDVDGKTKVKVSEASLKKEDEEKKRKDDEEKERNKRFNNEYWLMRWIEKRRTGRQEKFIVLLKEKISKERWNEKLVRRFVTKIDVRTSSECWEWLASTDTYGYGLIKIKGKTTRVHRFMYLLIYENTPEDRPFILHTCNNPPCCNPNHLKAGTSEDNNKYTVACGRGNKTKGEKNFFAILTLDEVNDIRERYKKGDVDLIRIAKNYNVLRNTIYEIVENRSWFDEEYQKWIDENKRASKMKT